MNNTKKYEIDPPSKFTAIACILGGSLMLIYELYQWLIYNETGVFELGRFQNFTGINAVILFSALVFTSVLLIVVGIREAVMVKKSKKSHKNGTRKELN